MHRCKLQHILQMTSLCFRTLFTWLKLRNALSGQKKNWVRRVRFWIFETFWNILPVKYGQSTSVSPVVVPLPTTQPPNGFIPASFPTFWAVWAKPHRSQIGETSLYSDAMDDSNLAIDLLRDISRSTVGWGEQLVSSIPRGSSAGLRLSWVNFLLSVRMLSWFPIQIDSYVKG